MSGTPPYRLKRPEPKEADVLRGVLRALELHPRVSRCWRMQTGAGKLVRASGASQWLRFGFTGCPDVMFYTVDGIAGFVEVKRPSGKLRPEQAEFLTAARNSGCIAFTAKSVTDVFAHLETTR